MVARLHAQTLPNAVPTQVKPALLGSIRSCDD